METKTEKRNYVQKLLRKIFSGKSNEFITNSLVAIAIACTTTRFALTIAIFRFWNMIAVNCFNCQSLTSVQVCTLSVIINICIMRHNNRKNKGKTDKLVTLLQIL